MNFCRQYYKQLPGGGSWPLLSQYWVPPKTLTRGRSSVEGVGGLQVNSPWALKVVLAGYWDLVF